MLLCRRIDAPLLCGLMNRNALVVKAGRYPGDVFQSAHPRYCGPPSCPATNCLCSCATLRVSVYPRRFTPKHFTTLSQWPRSLPGAELTEILAPCITYLLQLAVLRRRVILADVADRCAWVEVSTAYRALDAVLHGPPQINGMDLPSIFCTA